MIEFTYCHDNIDGRRIEVCGGGDAMMTFDLRDGRQWRKRVWPRKDFPKTLMRWNSVEVITTNDTSG